MAVLCPYKSHHVKDEQIERRLHLDAVTIPTVCLKLDRFLIYVTSWNDK